MSRQSRHEGMQVRFNQEGCFIKDKDQLIAHARREGHIFILDVTEVNTTMYAKGLKAESDIELRHKRGCAQISTIYFETS